MHIVLYLCNRKQCTNCAYPICTHTSNVAYAVNFKESPDHDGVFIETTLEEDVHDNHT